MRSVEAILEAIPKLCSKVRRFISPFSDGGPFLWDLTRPKAARILNGADSPGAGIPTLLDAIY
jgi:hypothetical protein